MTDTPEVADTTPVIRVYPRPNRKTRSGMPPKWRWQHFDADGQPTARCRRSLRTEADAIIDFQRNMLETVAVLRCPDRDQEVDGYAYTYTTT